MGRKKKKQMKPWCWYCNREFDDEKILIQHQKSRHFKCSFCHKKLYTGPGLSIHSMQVHKEKIDKIPFALPHRSNVELEIYGMEGIPDDDLKEHEKQKYGDEPEEKKPKVDIPLPATVPNVTLPNIPVASGIQYVNTIPVPIMPPTIPLGIGPPFLVRPHLPMPRPLHNHMHPLGPHVTQNNLIPVSQTSIQNLNTNSNLNSYDIPPPPPPPPPKVEPLAKVKSEPAFPAYSGTINEEKVISKVAQPTSSTPNVKVILIHPDDDIPLEQIRLRSDKYNHFTKKNPHEMYEESDNNTNKIEPEKRNLPETSFNPNFYPIRNHFPVRSWNQLRPPY